MTNTVTPSLIPGGVGRCIRSGVHATPRRVSQRSDSAGPAGSEHEARGPGLSADAVMATLETTLVIPPEEAPSFLLPPVPPLAGNPQLKSTQRLSHWVADRCCQIPATEATRR